MPTYGQTSGPARRRRRRSMAEINVVPYIDVMLVLLVIFMVTAPLYNLGVQIQLPQKSGNPVPRAEAPPVILIVDRGANFTWKQGSDAEIPVDIDEIRIKVQAALALRNDARFYVYGDDQARYGEVVAAFRVLEEAGAAGVGLLTETPGGSGR